MPFPHRSPRRRRRSDRSVSSRRSTPRATRSPRTSAPVAAGARRTSASPTASTSCLRSIVELRSPLAKSKVAVAALGGYGRRALCLHSDIDLLVVFEGRLGRAEERFVKALLHPLWDLKLQVGHQVRLLDDFAVLERDNPLYLLALTGRALPRRRRRRVRAARERLRALDARRPRRDARRAARL